MAQDAINMLNQSKNPTDDSKYLALTAPNRIVFIAVLYIYVIVITLIVIRNDTVGGIYIIPALMVQVSVLAIPFLLKVKADQFGWFHPVIFTVVLALVQLLRASPAYALGFKNHQALLTHTPLQLSKLLALKLLLLSAGYLAYYGGFFFFTISERRPLSFASTESRFSNSRLLITIGGSLLIAAWFFQQRGGVTAHFASFANTRHVSLAGQFYWIQLGSIAAWSCVIWVAYQPKIIRNPLFWTIICISLGTVFLMSGSRSSLLEPFIVLVMVYATYTRKIPVLALTAFAFFFIVVFGLLGEFRTATWGGDVQWNLLRPQTASSLTDVGTRFLNNEVVERITTGDTSLAVFAKVPSEESLLLGESYLAIATIAVPRSLWSGKPTLVDSRAGRAFYGINSGRPIGAVGEAYWNFHLPGVLMIFFLFGVFHRWLFAFYEANAFFKPVIVFYLVTLYTLSPYSSSIVNWLIYSASIAGIVFIAEGGFQRHSKTHYQPSFKSQT